jgi:predicted ATPase/DNA-binding SARP family transcriptional activator
VWEFRVLGTVAVVVDGQVRRLGATRVAALLADLVVHANEVVSTDRLVDDLWHADPPPGASATVHGYVRDLRRILSPADGSAARAVLITRRPGYVLEIEPDRIDARRAERLVAEGLTRRAGGDSMATRRLLGEALALWRGSAFGELADAPFLRAERARLEGLRLAALEARVQVDLDAGRHGELAAELERLVEAHPFNERFCAQLMLCLYRCGQQADALHAYQRLRRSLGDELGIDPGAEIRALEVAILRQQPDLDRSISLVDRGSGSDHVHGGGFDRLLVERSSFIGRDEEVARLLALVRPDVGAPVVTITGPGGVGKTRLAVEVAVRASAAFEGDAWFVRLAGVTDQDSVGDVVLDALRGGRRVGLPALAALGELTRDRRMLVVLDNCEHVLDAAARCVEVIAAASQGVVMTTSRQPLELPGERVYVLGGLARPMAVALFADRADAVDSSFRLDARTRVQLDELCRRLDDMPLAIELAAARMRSMSVEELMAGLDRRFRLLQAPGRSTVARHQTLRATVEWSYQLLQPADRAVFDQLSVFAGGFDRRAAVAVHCGDSPDHRDLDLDVADSLDALVARSMVVVDGARPTTRYALLETMREFGCQQLAVHGDEPGCRTRHAAHFLHVAEDARRRQSTPDGANAVAIFSDEWDNLRVAFEWMANRPDTEGALRLVIAPFWYAAESFRFELLDWAEQAISLHGATDHPLWPAAAGVTAVLRRHSGDLEGAAELGRRAVEVERARGGPPRFEPTMACWAYEWTVTNYDESRRWLHQLLRIANDRADPVELARVRYGLVIDHLVTGYELGRAADEAAEDAERTGVPLQLAHAYTAQLALAAYRDRAHAPALYTRARSMARHAGSTLLFDNASLWMCLGAEDAEPVQALAFARTCLIDTTASNYWGNFEMVLLPVVRSFIRLGEPDVAARVLGGLTAMPGQRTATQDLLDTFGPSLADTLGSDFDTLVAAGRKLSRRALANMAVAEIGRVVPSEPSSTLAADWTRHPDQLEALPVDVESGELRPRL